jgi:hypothetical protein
MAREMATPAEAISAAIVEPSTMLSWTMIVTTTRIVTL